MNSLLQLLWARFRQASGIEKLLLLLVIVAILLLLFLVRQPHRPPLPPPTSGPARAWFDCIECRNGELALVVDRALGDSTTMAVLTGVARGGPNAADTAAFAAGLRRTHARTTAWLAQHDTTVHVRPVAVYVADRLARWDRTWRARAASALGRVIAAAHPGVAGPAAQSALDAACADLTQHDTLVLEQLIWARMVSDTASVPCRDRAHALGIPLHPRP